MRYLIPSSAYIILLSYPIVSVLFGRGAFSEANVSDTAQCMLFYSIGIVFVALRTVYTRALYALKKVKSVTIISVITLGTNALLNAILVNTLGLKGLALATSIANIVTTAFMFAVLYRNNKLIRLMSIRSMLISIIEAVIQIALTYLLIDTFFDYDSSKIQNIAGLIIQGIILCLGFLIGDRIANKEKRDII